MTNDPKPSAEDLQPEKVKIDDILRRVDSLPILDPRLPDEMVGYDKEGIPAQNGASATGDLSRIME